MKPTITAAATLAIAGTLGSSLAACGSRTVKTAAAKPAAAHAAAASTGTAPVTRSVPAHAAKPDAAKPDAAKPDAAKPDAAKPDAAKPDAAEVAAPVGQAKVGRLLRADEAAVSSAPGGNAMKASYLVNAINGQRTAWNAVLNERGLSASARAGITDWLAFASQIQAYHGSGRDRVQVLATGARAQEELTSAYPHLSRLLPH